MSIIIPSATGVAQPIDNLGPHITITLPDSSNSGAPSAPFFGNPTFTKHIRQLPDTLKPGCQQKCGSVFSISIAASMIVEPAAASTLCPSIII